MKNLFASASYSFNNFYNNLNTQGQMIFSVIMFLIVVLCIMLFITYVIEGIKSRSKIANSIKTGVSSSKKIINVPNNKKNDTVKISKEKVNEISKKDKKEEPVVIKKEEKEPLYVEEKTEIEDIAKSIEDALSEESPVILTNFEENQEKTAIISIDELMKKAEELEIVEDEATGVNYLEKYNLEPAEVEEMVEKTTKKEEESMPVKAFKVSQVISPIYGVKKEAINNNKF